MRFNAYRCNNSARIRVVIVLLLLAFSAAGTAAANSLGLGGYVRAFGLPAWCNTAWVFTVLDAFTGQHDGEYPYGNLVEDRSGALYGTTYTGGASSEGSVFKLTPHGASGWTQSVIYSFTGLHGDGANPQAGLLVDVHGALYGTTFHGGGSVNCPYNQGCGTVFKLTPPQPGTLGWSETTLHAFTASGTDGSGPYYGPLIADATGALYGTTAYGGGSAKCGAGCGTVFKLTPPLNVKSPWMQTVLHVFTGVGGDGAFPLAGVVADSSGALYGVTEQGGISNSPSCPFFLGCGIVFELAPPRMGSTAWNMRVLHTFSISTTDGNTPVGGLTILGGSLYGTTADGGANGNGIVYKITPPQAAHTGWMENVLYSFAYVNSGSSPEASLLADPRGNLYGTTFEGGASSFGTAFELMPPRRGQTIWTARVLHAFSDTNGDGAYPVGGLITDQRGVLFGTTTQGGTTALSGHNCYQNGASAIGCGTAFKLQETAK